MRPDVRHDQSGRTGAARRAGGWRLVESASEHYPVFVDANL
jgi:hypothetical protein